MKKILSFVSLLSLVAACTQAPQGYKIEGSITNADDKVIVLSAYGADGNKVVDTLKITNGSFVSTGNIDYPALMTINVEGSRTRLSFFGENNKYTITADADSLDKGVVTSPSALQTAYAAVMSEVKEIQVKKDDVIRQYNQARAAGDNDVLEDLGRQYSSLDSISRNIMEQFIDSNPASPVSAMFVSVNHSFSDLDDMKSSVARLDASVLTSPYVLNLNKRIEVLEKVAIGQVAPDFEMVGVDGNSIRLSDFKGKTVLVDFWASWCGPCRQENPNVVKLYNQYKDKNFTILGVSLDTDREKWVKAIEDDQLTWSHVSDLEGWKNAAAAIYGVNSIPHTVLIDAEGVIIGKNLRGDDLANKLAEVL